MLGEVAMVAGLLAGTVTLQLTLSRSVGLFRRNLWLDEIVTLSLVTDRSLGHALRALAAGLDTNPPTYHVLLRALGRLTGNGGEGLVRGFSLLAVFAGLLGLYLSLRQVFEPLPAFAAVLTVWAHPLTQRYAFELRMYGPWLAAVIWFTYALGRAWENPFGLGPNVGLACTSLLASTLHTLGPLAVGLATAAHLLAHAGAEWPRTVLLGAAVGPLTFLAWAPLLWRQDAAYGASWMPALTWRSGVRFLRALLLPGYFAVTLLAAGAALLLTYLGTGDLKPAAEVPRAAPLAGLAALALLPLAVVFLSGAIGSILLERHALPAVGALALAAALAVAPLPVVPCLAVCGLLAVLGSRNLRQLWTYYRGRDESTAQLTAAIRKHTGSAPVVFEDPYELCVVCHYAPDVAGRCFGLDFEAGQLGRVDAYALGIRAQLRVFARFYPEPRLLGWETISRASPWYLVVSAERREGGAVHPEGRYPGFVAWDFWPGLYEMRQHSEPSCTSAVGDGTLPGPRVSVVVPNYNHARFLPERIDSLLGQTLTDFELIVLDDASTDNSREVLASYAGDPRVRLHYFSECSGSPYRRFNDGARMARGELLYVANSDDSCDPTMLEKLADALDRHPSAGLAYCHTRMVDPEGRELYSTVQWAGRMDRGRWAADYQDFGWNECRHLLLGNEVIPTTSAVLMRRCVFEQAGGFDETLPVGADYLLWVRMLLQSDVAFVAEPLNYWRWHPDSVSCRAVGPEGRAADLEDIWQVLLFLKENLDLPPEKLELACDRFVTMWIHRSLRTPDGLPAARHVQLYRRARRVDPYLRGRIRRLLFTTQDFFGSLDRLAELEGQHAALTARLATLEAEHAPFTSFSGAARELGRLALRAIRKRLTGSA